MKERDRFEWMRDWNEMGHEEQQRDTGNAYTTVPDRFSPYIESRAREYLNVVRFNEFPRGGHFAIHEQAEILAPDIREFF